MPIRNCPLIPPGLLKLWNRPAGPILNIKLINPHTKEYWKTFGIVDTGADDCAIPKFIAKELGHNFNAGDPSPFSSCSGEGLAYRHTTDLHIYHPITKLVVYKLEAIPIDYVEDLKFVLLGRNNFLNKFILNIDYPKEVFSLILPSSK